MLIDKLAEQGAWQLPCLMVILTKVGVLQGYVAWQVKFSRPAPDTTVGNFQDYPRWLGYITAPCIRPSARVISVGNPMQSVLSRNHRVRQMRQSPPDAEQRPMVVFRAIAKSRMLPAPPRFVRRDDSLQVSGGGSASVADVVL